MLPLPGQVPELMVDGQPKPGSWARYRVMARSGNSASLVRLAFFDRERGAQWVELSVSTDRRDRLVLRMLLQQRKGKDEPARVRRMIIQPPGQRAFQLPDQVAARHAAPVIRRSTAVKAKTLGQGSIQIAAGTFKAKRLRQTVNGTEVETWISLDKTSWPMLRMVLPTSIVELDATGSSAASQIDGEPLQMTEAVARQLGLIK
jgi:hypothetical protein